MKSNFPSVRDAACRFGTALLPWTLALRALAVSAATESYTFSPGLAIPDGTTAGLADTHTLVSSLVSLTDINVTLDLSVVGAGGFNGDLYATLVHESGFSVLLNRVGRSATVPFGYGDQGIAITLDDQAAANVHTYRTTLFGSETTPLAGALGGSWKPDGRTSDPFLTSTMDLSTAGLGNFNGTAGSGEWVLFLADVERGGTLELTQWTLTLSGAQVPEATTLIGLFGLAGLVGWQAWRRSRRP